MKIIFGYGGTIQVQKLSQSTQLRVGQTCVTLKPEKVNELIVALLHLNPTIRQEIVSKHLTN